MSARLTDVAQTALSATRAAQESQNADDFVDNIGRSFCMPGGTMNFIVITLLSTNFEPLQRL